MKNSVKSDWLFWLLGINMFLVIIGYALSVLTKGASIAVMRGIKYTFLGLSIISLLGVSFQLLSISSRLLKGLLVLSAAFFVFSLFTEIPYLSVIRALTFIVPLLYVAFTVSYLVLKYPMKEVLDELLSIINWIYFIPIASFFISGGSLSDTNIYFISSSNDETAFVSNHYGWSGTIFLVTGMDLLRNRPMPFWRKLLIIALSGVALYLVLISGNRTSWLSLAFVALVFLFRYKRISLGLKAVISLMPVGLIMFLLQDPDSSLNTRIKKTETQAKKGERRVQVGKRMIAYFNENPLSYLTGIGMFNKEKVKTVAKNPSYHNSYFEVIFGSGFIVASAFIFFFLLRVVWNYTLYFSQHYIFLAPFIIIPYFESNLTGGQFLFFPWFSLIIVTSYAHVFANVKQKIRAFRPQLSPRIA